MNEERREGSTRLAYLTGSLGQPKTMRTASACPLLMRSHHSPLTSIVCRSVPVKSHDSGGTVSPPSRTPTCCSPAGGGLDSEKRQSTTTPVIALIAATSSLCVLAR